MDRAPRSHGMRASISRRLAIHGHNLNSAMGTLVGSGCGLELELGLHDFSLFCWSIPPGFWTNRVSDRGGSDLERTQVLIRRRMILTARKPNWTKDQNHSVGNEREGFFIGDGWSSSIESSSRSAG